MSLFVVKSAMERAEGRRVFGGGWSSKGKSMPKKSEKAVV